MAEDEEAPNALPKSGRTPTHVIGERLDDLSIRDFDDRIAVLRAEIERLDLAKDRKQAALTQAGSIFKS